MQSSFQLNCHADDIGNTVPAVKERKAQTRFICCQSFVNKIKTTEDENAFAPAADILMKKESPTEKAPHDRQSVNLSDPALDQLLPHRGRMLLIGDILEVDGTHAVTLSKAAASWPMADPDGVSPLILVELAAQTAGVCNGWDRIKKLGTKSEQMGWLVGVKRADFFVELLPFDLPVTARAENTMAFEKFREVTSQLFHRQQLLAEVVLQLYQV